MRFTPRCSVKFPDAANWLILVNPIKVKGLKALATDIRLTLESIDGKFSSKW